ncbi:MAG: hypothetical protein OIN66_11695 [Candidatus Methanoperedens sp.]|nr:hypothetical protein [Candidatus Methanoperedens sp.]
MDQKDLKLDEDTHHLLKLEAVKRKTTMPKTIRALIVEHGKRDPA